MTEAIEGKRTEEVSARQPQRTYKYVPETENSPCVRNRGTKVECALKQKLAARLALYCRNFCRTAEANSLNVTGCWQDDGATVTHWLMLNGKERRRWVRHQFYAPVRISWEGGNHSSVIEGRCLKLSEGGMSLFAAANVAVGTRVRIDFLSTASDKRISVTGTVRNRMVYLYGVEY